MQVHATDGAGQIPIVCPTCSDVLAADGLRAELEAGDPIHAFCARCERTVEVPAPTGIQAFTSDGVDEVDASAMTEFPLADPEA